MLVRDGKYLIGLKIFATFALVCTLVLWAGLWIASATPGTESGASTQFVTDKIDSKYDVSSKFDAKVVTQNITLERTGTERFYADQSEQLKLTFSPQNTLDKEVYFESENEDIVTVNSNGVATCHSWGSTYVYVRLKSNPSVYNFVEINCYGKNPQDIPNNAISLPDTIKVGTSALTAVNDRQTAPDCATFASSDDSVAAVHDGYVYGISAGEATITATFDCGKSASTTVIVEDNPDFVMPQKIVFKQNPTLIHGKMGQNYLDLIESVEPQGASTDFTVISSDSQLLTARANGLFVTATGTVELIYTSVYNPSLSESVTVTLKKNPPTELRISGKDVITPHSTAVYKAAHMPTAYASDVKWEVVKGKATITSKGALVAQNYGKVVIRCTSTIDPSIYVEKTVEVKLFSNTYEMVRKFMGHGGLSALLGFGIVGTLFLLCKRKWGCAVLSAPLCFIYAGVSEGIQYFTPGRFCAITDVLIDFIGCLIGMAVATVLVAVVLVIWRLASKKSFESLSYAYRNLNFGNLLKKTYKFDAPYVRELPATSHSEALEQAACDEI